jgi:short-chain fatty acids transporter
MLTKISKFTSVKMLKLYNSFFEKYFPSPLSIAILLSFLTFFLCVYFTGKSSSTISNSTQIGMYWFQGMWNQNLLAFTLHMMLILILGHILALSKPAEKAIAWGLKFCHDNASTAFTVSILTIMVSMFNWGLGLIFGAIMARKAGEYFKKQGKNLNYPLIGAAAYGGMMTWHGGLSGSATLTVAGKNHSLYSIMGTIPLTETTFSPLNIFVTILLLTILPATMYLLGKKTTGSVPLVKKSNFELKITADKDVQAIEKSPFFGIFTGAVILLFFLYLNFQKVAEGTSPLALINLETTNLLLLGLCFLFHKNITSFSAALEEAISDASGILIQFPLYFGIMGMMQSSGLGNLISNAITNSSGETMLAFYTFASAGIVNIFIPSGGGQWQMQGPIIVEAAQKMNAGLPKLIMALCYGDQLTNMLQPFWALPLLGITGLKAKEILPYTLFIFLIGTFIFMLGLAFF